MIVSKESFWQIFRDTNDWNEKTIVGSVAFLLMIVYVIVYLISKPLGFEFELNEMIFDSLVTITLGSFGIAEISKAASSWQSASPLNHFGEFREREVEDEDPQERDRYKELD